VSIWQAVWCRCFANRYARVVGHGDSSGDLALFHDDSGSLPAHSAGRRARRGAARFSRWTWASR
jgi:hypothetical protein